MPQLFPVTIGQFTAQGFSVPEKLTFGGMQRLGVHQLPGGVRIIDAMGADDGDIEWKGMLLAGDVPDPVAAAEQIDQMRKQGAPAMLSWDTFQFLVVIDDFRADYEFTSRISFEIKFKVVQDMTLPVQSSGPNNIDTLMNGDMGNTLAVAQSLSMIVPSLVATAFSTTTGSQSAGPTAITWAPGGIP